MTKQMYSDFFHNSVAAAVIQDDILLDITLLL